METKKKVVRFIETYVREHKLAPADTRPSVVESKLQASLTVVKQPQTEIAVNAAG